MNLDKNVELVIGEFFKLNERFNVFENLHEDIQELLCDEITSLRMSVIEWISGVAKRIGCLPARE